MEPERLLALIKARRSIRRFTDRRPDREMIDAIVEAARWAPSNHNRQGWKFIVFEDRREIQALADQVREAVEKTLAGAHHLAVSHSGDLIAGACAFRTAPVVILAMHKRRPAMGDALLESAVSGLASGEAISTAMAVANLVLAASAAGLGTCVMTAPLLAGEAWSGVPDLPAGFEPTCLVTVGYPAEHPQAPRRKALRHIIEYR